MKVSIMGILVLVSLVLLAKSAESVEPLKLIAKAQNNLDKIDSRLPFAELEAELENETIELWEETTDSIDVLVRYIELKSFSSAKTKNATILSNLERIGFLLAFHKVGDGQDEVRKEIRSSIMVPPTLFPLE